jgi:hypothetical protein
MKVTKIEGIIEKINSSSGTYLRENGGDWIYQWDYLKNIDKEEEEKLETAYQKFKKPPFKVEIYNSYMHVTIGTEHFSMEGSNKCKERLEQALNSLMEGK